MSDDEIQKREQALTVADLRDHAGVKVISHHTLAERLDVEPHDLVKVMRRLAEEDPCFGGMEVLGTFSENPSAVGGRPKVHYLLDEHLAITVTLESRSKRRHALRKQIIDVYLAVKGGGAVPPDLLATIRQTNEKIDALTVRLATGHDELARRISFLEKHVAAGSVITEAEHKAISNGVSNLALHEFHAENRGHKNLRAARRDIWNELGEVCMWGRGKQPWRDLPRERLYAARVVLARRLGAVEKVARVRERQLAFPGAAE